MSNATPFQPGELVFILDREQVGTIVEIEHITDYVLDDSSFEAPKLPSYRIDVGHEEIWRKASELRAMPEEIVACVIDESNALTTETEHS